MLTAAFCAVAVAASVVLVPDAATGAVLVTGVVASVLLCAAVTAATYARLTARAAGSGWKPSPRTSAGSSRSGPG